MISVKRIAFFSCIVIFLVACSSEGNQEVNRAFYFWKSDWLRETEEQFFNEVGAKKLYIKVFEITLDEMQGAIPVSKSFTQLSTKFLKGAEITPCVFIENEVIAKSTNEQLDELAENTVFLVRKFMDSKLKKNQADQLNWKELQIDCDWMESSKEQYFYFLKQLRKHTDKKLSCTLRLYPYKFSERMGVPPVDRAMLLCYNLLNPRSEAYKNSIMELGELKKYLVTDKKYPLPLDVSLPSYSSCYVFSNGLFEQVYHGIPENLESVCLPSEDGLWYIVKQDTALQDNYFKQGQRLRIERVSAKQLLEATRLVVKYVHLDENATVGLYHLDENELKNYSHETLDSVFLLFDQR